MRSFIVGIAAAGLMVSGCAFAVDMPEIARQKKCVVCHAVEKKVVGPSWTDVAKKYKGDVGAKARLVTKTMKGGVGVWGDMPMPPTPSFSEAEAGTLVDFILGLSK